MLYRATLFFCQGDECNTDFAQRYNKVCDQVLVSFIVSSMDEANWFSKISVVERSSSDSHCCDAMMTLHDLGQYDDFSTLLMNYQL